MQNPESDFILRLRGLPFEAGAPEIIQFFEGKYSSLQAQGVPFVPMSVSCHNYYYSQSSCFVSSKTLENLTELQIIVRTTFVVFKVHFKPF